MAERLVAQSSVVSIGTAEAVALLLYGSADVDPSLSALPTVSVIGAHTIRIRGTLIIQGTLPTGNVTVNCRRGQTTAGTLVPGSIVVPAPTVAGQPVPFEFWDIAPALPALNYAITTVAATTAGSATNIVIAEIEEVN